MPCLDEWSSSVPEGGWIAQVVPEPNEAGTKPQKSSRIEGLDWPAGVGAGAGGGVSLGPLETRAVVSVSGRSHDPHQLTRHGGAQLWRSALHAPLRPGTQDPAEG